MSVSKLSTTQLLNWMQKNSTIKVDDFVELKYNCGSIETFEQIKDFLVSNPEIPCVKQTMNQQILTGQLISLKRESDIQTNFQVDSISKIRVDDSSNFVTSEIHGWVNDSIKVIYSCPPQPSGIFIPVVTSHYTELYYMASARATRPVTLKYDLLFFQDDIRLQMAKTYWVQPVKNQFIISLNGIHTIVKPIRSIQSNRQTYSLTD
jgi:hypothetical protein